MATCIACDVGEEVVLDGLLALAADVRGGARLDVALRTQLERLLPADESIQADLSGDAPVTLWTETRTFMDFDDQNRPDQSKTGTIDGSGSKLLP